MESRKVHGCPIEYRLNEKKKRKVFFSLILCLYLELFPANRSSFCLNTCVPGWVLRISSDRDDQMGAKIKSKKNPQGLKQNPRKSLDQNLTPQKSHAGFPSHKNFQRNFAAGICRNYQVMNLHIVLNTHKNPYLNQASPKNTCQNFPT